MTKLVLSSAVLLVGASSVGAFADERDLIPGACCLPDGSCVKAGRYECQGIGGQWQGPGTNCALVACRLPARPCPADFDGDGLVDPSDLSSFIQCYFGGECDSDPDINGDGQVNDQDLADFVEHYTNGC